MPKLNSHNLLAEDVKQLVASIGSISKKIEDDSENASLFHQRGLLRVELHKAAEKSGNAAYMDDHLGDACMDFEEALHFSEDAKEIARIHKDYGDTLALCGDYDSAKGHYKLAGNSIT